jgi:hypothetical protein
MSDHGKESGHTNPIQDKHSDIIMSVEQNNQDTTMNASGVAAHNTTAQESANDEMENDITTQVPDVSSTNDPQYVQMHLAMFIKLTGNRMTTVAEGDGQGTNEGHDGHHDAPIPGEDVEAVAVVKKEEPDEEANGDASVPGEGEADTGTLDEKDEDVKEEEPEDDATEHVSTYLLPLPYTEPCLSHTACLYCTTLTDTTTV